MILKLFLLKKVKRAVRFKFTYANLLKDFETYKKDKGTFWEMIVQVHNYNIIDREPPKLGGIDSRQF